MGTHSVGDGTTSQRCGNFEIVDDLSSGGNIQVRLMIALLVLMIFFVLFPRFSLFNRYETCGEVKPMAFFPAIEVPDDL